MATRSAEAGEGPDAAKVASIAAGVVGLVLTLGALAFFGTRAGLSVAIGAVLAVANLVTMSAIVRAMLRPAEAEAATDESASASGADDPAASASATGGEEAEVERIDHAAEGKRGAAAWGAFGLFKILVLFGGIYVLLTKGMVDPIPLVVGYGALPLGIAASSLSTGLGPRRQSSRRRSPPRTK